MKRPRYIPYAKHIRQAKRFLRSLGAVEIKFEINGRCFLSWSIFGHAMFIAFACARAVRHVYDFEAAIQDALRRHGLLVSA